MEPKLAWHKTQSVATAKPVPGIILYVTKWKKCWGWDIMRDDKLPFLAKGTASTCKQGQIDAEQAWASLNIGCPATI